MVHINSLENKFSRDYGGPLLRSCVFITVVSQMPTLIQFGVSRFLPLLWLALALYLLKTQSIQHEVMLISSMLVLSLSVAILVGLASGIEYYRSSLFFPAIICIIMMICGSLARRYFFHDDGILQAYLIATIIVAADVYFKYLRAYNWNNLVYAYASKNSVSQILLTAIIISVYIAPSKKRALKACYFALDILLIVELFALRSRASIVGLPILCLIFLNSKAIDKKTKGFISVCVLGLVCLVLLNEEMGDFIFNNILLNNRSSGNIDAITSNRFSMVMSFPSLFSESPFLGRGPFYVENFYLVALLQFGLFFGVPIIVFSLLPLAYSLAHRLSTNKNYSIMLTLAATYSLNGLFEAQAPLGPGVKCFLLWFLLGALIGRPLIDGES